MHWTRRHCRGRPPHPDVLTPAEWRVLELVREGKTNAEIANDLGLAIPTVKTHVSRIFEKTGTANRQELASWDGAPSEVSRTALGRGVVAGMLGWLSGASTGAEVAGVALGGGAVLVGALALLYLAFGSDELRGGVTPGDGVFIGYYMESTVESEWRPANPVFPIERPQSSVSRGWFVDDQRWRVEGESRGLGVMLAYQMTTVPAGAGDMVLIHERFKGTWRMLPREETIGNEYRSQLGPTAAKDVDELIEFLGNEYRAEVARVGTGEVRSQQVEILEFDVAVGDDLSLTHRVYIEPDQMVVVAHEINPDGEGRHFRYDITHLEQNVAIDPSQLELTPPPGTVVHPVNGGPDCDGAASPGGFLPPARLLSSDYTPEGWTTAITSGWTQGADCDVFGAHLDWQPASVANPARDYILLEQARIPSGIPHWLALGDPVDVAGHEGYRTTDGDIERLIWARDGVVAMLEARGAAFEELLRIAESARLVTDAQPAGTRTPQVTATAAP